jgi:hypothetical protein
MDEPEILGAGSLSEAIASGNTRLSLTALRDYVAHELEGNRCDRCRMSQLKTGDTAALVLRLQKLIEDLKALGPEQNLAEEQKKGVTNLASIRNARPSDRPTEAPDTPRADLGTKAAPRRQGGRKKSG